MTTQELARQLTSNSLLIADICVCVICLFHLAREMRTDGWYVEWSNKLVIAIFAYFSAMAVVRMLAAIRVWGIARGRAPLVDYADDRYYISLTATFIAVLGLMCFIRIVSPPELRRIGWVVSASLVVFTLCLTYWLSLPEMLPYPPF